MLDRQKIETILTRRFPGATHQQVAAAANAIMGLSEEWEEVVDQGHEFGRVPAEIVRGSDFRLFRRREI